MTTSPLSAEKMIEDLKGPGLREQWMYWRSKSHDQRNRGTAMTELDRLLQSNKGVRTDNHMSL